MSKHHKFGGSTAHRTIACSAWHRESEGIERPVSTAMEYGTALHEAVLEVCLLDPDVDPMSLEGREFNGFTMTQDDILDRIYPALDAFEALMDKYDIDRLGTEVYQALSEDIGGTTDFVGVSEDGRTFVMGDLKTGDGVLVSPDNNQQGLFYFMCLLSHPQWGPLLRSAEKLVFAIVQPTERLDDPLSVWELTMAAVAQFIEQHKEAVIRTRDVTDQPVPGSHCRFCPAEATCSAKSRLLQAPADNAPAQLVGDKLAMALTMKTEMENWIKAVDKRAREVMESGGNVPGFKLVAKRANRVWNDADAVMDKIRKARSLKLEDTTSTKLLSPAQVEKVCKEKGVDFEKMFKDQVSKVSSGTNIKPDADHRPEVEISPVRADLMKRLAG